MFILLICMPINLIKAKIQFLLINMDTYFDFLANIKSPYNGTNIIKFQS